MTARAGDALSHVNFRPPQTAFSSAICGQIGGRNLAAAEGVAGRLVHCRNIRSARNCMGAMSRRDSFESFTLHLLCVRRTKIIEDCIYQ